MRSLSWDGFLNVRDLGGLPLEGGGETRYGRVARSEAPLFLTERGWQELADHGVRRIVDLRCPSEGPYEVRHGVEHVPVPMFRQEDPEFLARVDGLPDSGAFYRVLVDFCHATIAEAVAAVADAPPDAAVLVHCHAGRDRTGIVAAFLLSVAGVPDEAIGEDYYATRAALTPRHEQELAEAASEEDRYWLERIHAVEPEFVLAALDEARERDGDVRSYLRRGGVSDAQLDAIRARLAG